MHHTFICNPDTAVVSTTKGKIRGYIYDDVYYFKGIPYATAKRFHKPEALEPWDGVRVCTSYSYVCPLTSMDKPNGELMVPHRYWVMNEDCQNLNVFTPGTDDKKRPVLVWFHGGGYYAGSAIEHDAYEGGNMASFGDVVVVSVNHRLNILGYLDLSAFGEEYENSGNAGTADLIASLQWVHDNIAAFGGDPENVTIFGQSGGGGKITALLQSPEADGLYAKGIIMSGVLGMTLKDSREEGKELVEAIMGEISITNVKELETVDYHDFARAYTKIKPEFERAGKYTGCTPHVNSHYAGDPNEHGFRQETKEIPLIVGTVFGEFLSFGPPVSKNLSEEDVKSILERMISDQQADELMQLFKSAYPERKPADFLTMDFLFRFPEIPYIAARSKSNHATWSYLFNQDFEIEGGKTPWHCSDIPYVFHNCQVAPYTQQDGMEELQEQIFATVIAFARNSNPNNSRIPEWKPSESGAEHTLLISEKTKVVTNHDHALIEAYGKIMGPVLGQLMGMIMGGGGIQH